MVWIRVAKGSALIVGIRSRGLLGGTGTLRRFAREERQEKLEGIWAHGKSGWRIEIFKKCLFSMRECERPSRQKPRQVSQDEKETSGVGYLENSSSPDVHLARPACQLNAEEQPESEREYSAKEGFSNWDKTDWPVFEELYRNPRLRWCSQSLIIRRMWGVGAETC